HPVRRAWRGSRSVVVPGQSVLSREKLTAPLPVSLVEHVSRTDVGCPCTTDTICAGEAKPFHQIDQSLAQSRICKHLLGRFYLRDFDVRLSRNRHIRGLLSMWRERPCSRHAAKQSNDRAPHHSITSSASASNLSEI